MAKEVALVSTPSVKQALPEDVQKMLDHLFLIDPPVIMSGFDEKNYDEKNESKQLFDALMGLADKEVMNLISWVKKLPGINDAFLLDLK